ncbi:MAG: hypothetical protein ABIT38_06710 [Gemmatimonadaceae bacterium]
MQFLVRRGDSRLELTLTPVLGCEIPSLSVTMTSPSLGGTLTGSDPARATAPIDLGMRLECGSCGWRVMSGGERRWYASKSPVVVGLEAGGPAEVAGVKRGGVQGELDGASFVAPDSSSRLGSLRTGAPLVLLVRRAGRICV